MSERSRILKLVEDGKITPDEATLLLEALAELETPARGFGFAPPVPPIPPEPPEVWGRGSRKLERLSEAARQLGRQAEEIGRRVGLQAEELGRRVAEELGGAGGPVTISYPSHLKWIKAELIGCDLEVRVDPSLDKPSITGDVAVAESGGHLLISGSPHPNSRRSGREAVPPEAGYTFKYSPGDDPVIRVPEGWGLACELVQGDLSVEGLPYVRGKVLTGATTLRKVAGVDLVASDDLTAELCLTEGQHHLSMLNGDAEITFVHSSVRVEGRLLNGELDARGPFEQRKRKISGLVGAGEALLHIQVLNGDLTLEDQGHHKEEEEV
jgi:hypothetical protein